MIKKACLITISIVFIFVLCSGKVSLQAAHKPLIKKNEQVLFSFKVKNSEKIATIAIGPGDPGYIVYRFGVKDKIELEFPPNKESSWKHFTYSWYLRGGGPENLGMDINRLTFVNGDYTYTIYEDYDSENDTEKIAVEISNQKSNQLFHVIGDNKDTIGSLIDLRTDRRIKAEEI